MSRCGLGTDAGWRWGVLGLLLCAVSAVSAPPEGVTGEAVAVVWQTRTVSGAPAGLGLSVFDAETLHEIGSTIRLPGSVLSRGISTFPGSTVAAMVTREAADSTRSYLNFVRLDRFTPVIPDTPLYSSGEYPTQVEMAPGGTRGEVRAALLTRNIDRPGGRVLVFGLRLDGEQLTVDPIAGHPVAGTPETLEVDWLRQRAYVMGVAAGGDTNIATIDFAPGGAEPRVTTISTSSGSRDPRRAMRLADAGQTMVYAESGYEISDGTGRRESSIRLLDTDTWGALGDAVPIAGAIRAASAAIESAGDEIWVSTLSTSGAFGYATRLSVTDTGLVKTAEESATQADLPPIIAASPKGIAMASGSTLRIFDGRDSGDARLMLNAPIEAAAWFGDRLIAGAGAELHRVDPESESVERTSARADGFVIALARVGRPVDATMRPPARAYPSRLYFEPGSPGRAEYVLPLRVSAGQRVVVVADDETRSWLRLARLVIEDDTPALALSVREQSPATRGTSRLDGSIRVIVQDESGAAIEGSETRIDISSSAPAIHPTLIQWQGSQSGRPMDEQSVDALMRLLGSAPLHLSHRLRSGPVVSPPPASVVVIGLDAAVEGTLTRQVLLDYVAQGGGLLFLGRHDPESEPGGLRRWLEPLDIAIDASQRVEGRFDAPALPFGIAQLAVAAGCYVETLGPMEQRIPEEPATGAVLAARRYGYGRIAVLAAPTPLESAALQRSDGRRFARALFGWLAGNGTDIRDSDFDGLPDRVEDANGNGRADAGETSFLGADTDGDGVPDGLEDVNLNGRVDEGETDPRNPDTDGDGIPDGADASPLPVAGTPVLLAVNPSSGPAEGGTLVELTGRNLPIKSVVWFGESRSPHVVRIDSERMLAATPEQPGQELRETVSVRVAHPIGTNQGRLDHAFTFADRSLARLTLESVSSARRTYDGYRGEMTIVLHVPDVRIDYVAFRLWVDPGLEHFELGVERSEALAALGRTIAIRRYGLMEHGFVIGVGEPISGRIELGTLAWRLADVPAPSERLHVFFRSPDVRAQWGGGLTMEVTDARLDLHGAHPADAAPGGELPVAPG